MPETKVYILNPARIINGDSFGKKEVAPKPNTGIFSISKNLRSILDMAKVRPTEHLFGLRLTFHCIGISCLAGAVFLQILVFMNITYQGFFMGAEKNPLILNSEIGLTIFCVVYLLYLSISKITSFLNS